MLENKKSKAEGTVIAEGRLTRSERLRAIASNLAVISHRLEHSFDRKVEAIGLSRAKWRLIAAVSHRPGATQRMIAEMLSITEVSVGRLVDRLCADGLLERRDHPTDHRAYRVYLSRAADTTVERLSRIGTVVEQEAFGGLEDEELKRLHTILEAIEARLSARAPARTQEAETTDA